MQHRRPRAALLPLLVVAVSAACSKAAAPPPSPSPYAPPPTTAAVVKVVDVEVGRAVDMDKRISDKTDSFKPTDTIYASVATEGAAPSKTVVAKWTFGTAGKPVKTDSQTIAPAGPASTEFHITKPSGWPAGKYKVEISVDGSPAGSKEFEVKK